MQLKVEIADSVCFSNMSCFCSSHPIA